MNRPYGMESGSLIVFSALSGIFNAQLLQFPVQMGTLKPDLLGYPRDITHFLAQVVIEIKRVEMLTRRAQWQIERQGNLLYLTFGAQSLRTLRFNWQRMQFGITLLDGLGHRVEQFLQRNGFFQKIHCADAGSLDRRLYR